MEDKNKNPDKMRDSPATTQEAPASSVPAPCESLLPSAYHGNSHDQHEDEEQAGFDLQSPFRSETTLTASSTSNPMEPNSTDATLLRWRPFYLKRTVLLEFLLLFILILTAVETLLFVSKRDYGIATSEPEKHYLWTYGPTAFLTILAAMWTRVEYQSKLVAPWIRLSQPGNTASQPLLLDYVSQFPPFVLFTSVRNRDFLVFMTTAVGISIKIIIVISTGLITLTWTRVEGWYPMVIQDQIVDSDAQLRNVGTLSWHMMQELGILNMSLPDGISSDYAFQSVKTNLPASAETRVTVEGLTNSLDCQAADVKLLRAWPASDVPLGTGLNLTIKSPGCTVSNLGLGGAGLTDELGDTPDTQFARFSRAQCDGITGDAGRRVLVIFGEIIYHRDYSRNVTDDGGERVPQVSGTMKRSTQLLCTPSYTITNVEVVRNGTQLKAVTTLQGSATRTLKSVSAWSIMDAHYAASDAVLAATPSYYLQQSIDVSSTHVDVDTYAQTLLRSQMGPSSDVLSLCGPGVLQQVATRYYRQFGAAISKQSLMQPRPTSTTGFAIVNQYRLIVGPWAAQWMAGLVIFCMVLQAVSLFLVSKQGILPCNPSSLLGIASLVLGSGDLLRHLRFAGSADGKLLAQYLKFPTFQSRVEYNSNTGQAQFRILNTKRGNDKNTDRVEQANLDPYHPALLHPVCRSSLCIGLVSLIIALEGMLQRSNKYEGIGDAGGLYLHYTWTALPALILGLLSTILSAVDSQVRTLAPYILLKRTVYRGNLPHLDLLDASVPYIIYKEIKLANIGLFATTMTFLVASLFTTLSASLFQVLPIPIMAPVTLRTDKFFQLDHVHNTGNMIKTSSTMASLIFEANVSYPRFTYDDLAFPELSSATSLPAGSSLNTTTSTIAAVIPSVRGRLSCRLYDPSKIKSNLTLGYINTTETSILYQSPLRLRIEGEGEGGYRSGSHDDACHIILSTYANATYFGTGVPMRNFDSDHFWAYSDFLYAWGRINYKTDPIVQHVAALGCNMTYEVVDVDTTFASVDLDLDLQSPPRPRENTARNGTIPPSSLEEFSRTFSYAYLSIIKSDPQLLDKFFSLLVSSPWAIPLSDLGDPSASDRITAAIKKHHGIALAQYIAQHRFFANQSDDEEGDVTTTPPAARALFLPAPGDPTDPNITISPDYYNATMTDATSHRRVVQDAGATRALEALLGTALVFFALGWAALPRTDVLPRGRSVTSIASVAALLAGGDLLTRLPPDAQHRRSDKEVAAALRGAPGGGGMRVWMGWGVVVGPDDVVVVEEDGRRPGVRGGGGENEAGPTRQFGIFVRDDVVDDNDDDDDREDGEQRQVDNTGAERSGGGIALQPMGYRGVATEE